MLDDNYAQTYSQIRAKIISAKKNILNAINFEMVVTYHEIGEQIYLACGENGKDTIEVISQKLTKEFGNGYDVRNIKVMREFYKTFPVRESLCAELSWSHYKALMRVGKKEIRDWYFAECIESCWSVKQLERQINTMFYERLLSSQDKQAVREEIDDIEPRVEYDKIIRDPYIMEFLDLEKSTKYYEKDLEEAIINQLQRFLLELGRGFCFEARQKHFRVEDDHFYIDLVFYNYILKCHVLIDLKMGKLTHQDLGQMQMYVNYYTRKLMNEGDNPPIGIVLCADKTDTIVKYTLPEDNNQIFAAKYMTYLPTEEEIKRELNLEEYIKLD